MQIERTERKEPEGIQRYVEDEVRSKFKSISNRNPQLLADFIVNYYSLKNSYTNTDGALERYARFLQPVDY